MRRCFLFLILLISLDQSLAQTANFSVQTTACLNEVISLTNTSTSATHYSWDFCQDGLLHPEGNVSAVVTVPSNIPVGMEVVYDHGNWYGFVCSRDGSSNKLIRVSFGTSLSNTNPTILPDFNSTINSSLNGVSDIKFLYLNSKWYGFVANHYSGDIIRLEFGSSLSNASPDVVNLGHPGSWSSIYGLDIIQTNGDVILAVTGNGSNTVSFVNYTTTIDSAIPVASGVNTISSADNALITSPVKINLVQTSSGWYALFSSLAGKIVQLNLGNNPMSPPLSITSVADISTVSALQLEKDGNNYFAFAQNSTGDLYRLNFGSDMVNVPHVDLLGNFGGVGSTYGLAVVKDWPEWRAFFVGVFSNVINRLDFKDDCSTEASLSRSTLTTPENLSYLSPGSKWIELAAYDASGNISTMETQITVQNLQAPRLNFSTDNSCVGQVNHFAAFSEEGFSLSNTQWDFGNGNMAIGNTASFQFPAVDEYLVKLSSTGANGCSNKYSEMISIFNPPIADFGLPLEPVLCTNEPYTFINSSSIDTGSSPTWKWKVNGVETSTNQDMIQLFTNTNNQSIQLVASIPGCSSQSTQNFAVQHQGPLTDFSIVGKCQNDAIQFTNQTIGDVTSFNWDFGDGHTSMSTNSQNVYTNIGSYSVKLIAANAEGCNNSMVKQLTVYSKPQPNFAIDLPPFSCNGSVSQFNDLTPGMSDSNIVTWLWNFGDAPSGTSVMQHAKYTYALAGQYNVSLTTTSNFGCSGTTQKPVTIQQSPQAAFTNSIACLNTPTNFTDTSTGAIKSRLWNIGANTYTTPTVINTFTTTGNSQAQLTVTANNNCVATVARSIIIPVPPAVNFSIQNSCSGQDAVFTDTTPVSMDPIASLIWDFANQGTGSGSPVSHNFATIGTYPIKMTATTQSGCLYPITKNVVITKTPTADFISSTESGPPPLQVEFTNTSKDATSFFWEFNDPAKTTSTALSPSFTYTTLGNYTVNLTATSLQGCKDIFTKGIQVIIPAPDLAIDEFSLIKNTVAGTMRMSVVIHNKGNSVITGAALFVDISGVTLLREIVPTSISPGQTLTYLTVTEVVLRADQMKFVCAEVSVTNDQNLSDNKECASEGDLIYFPPYPNPSDGALHLDWIALEGSSADVRIINSFGQEVYSKQIGATREGLNQLEFDVSSLSPGTYILIFQTGGNKKSFKFMAL